MHVVVVVAAVVEGGAVIVASVGDYLLTMKANYYVPHHIIVGQKPVFVRGIGALQLPAQVTRTTANAAARSVYCAPWHPASCGGWPAAWFDGVLTCSR